MIDYRKCVAWRVAAGKGLFCKDNCSLAQQEHCWQNHMTDRLRHRKCACNPSTGSICALHEDPALM